MEFQDMKFKKLMRENKKEDLCNLYLESEAEIKNLCEIVKGLQKSLEESQEKSKQDQELSGQIAEKWKGIALEKEETLEFLRGQNAARKTEIDRLQRHIKTWSEKINKYNGMYSRFKKGVMIHTDGTAAGSTVWIDGVQPHDLTTAKVKVNIRYGVQASLETYKHGRFKRHWIYGEDYYPQDFAPIPFRPEDGEGVAPQRWIPKESVTKCDNIQEDFSHSDHPDLWECGSCWSVNPLREEDKQKESLQCPICRQWTYGKKMVES